MKPKKQIECCGKTVTFDELAEQLGMTVEQIRHRYKNGLRDEDLIAPAYKVPITRKREKKVEEPKEKRWDSRRRYFYHFGKLYTFQELSAETGLSDRLLRQRYEKGFRDEDLVRPINQHSQRRYTVNLPNTTPYTRQELYELWKGCKHRIKDSQIKIMAGFMGLPGHDKKEAKKLISEFERMG